MGDYSDGNSKNSSSQINISQNIDVNSISDAIIKAIGNRIGNSNPINQSKDDFDNSASLERLAQAMVIQRDNKESNFDNLGETKISKKDVQDTNNTIDLLRGLD